MASTGPGALCPLSVCHPLSVLIGYPLGIMIPSRSARRSNSSMALRVASPTKRLGPRPLAACRSLLAGSSGRVKVILFVYIDIPPAVTRRAVYATRRWYSTSPRLRTLPPARPLRYQGQVSPACWRGRTGRRDGSGGGSGCPGSRVCWRKVRSRRRGSGGCWRKVRSRRQGGGWVLAKG